MSKHFFALKEDTAAKAVIHLYGPIGWDNTWWGDGTNNEAFAFVSLLKRIDKEGKEVHLHINSPGGSISDGLAIYNTLRNMVSTVHTHNDGLCASMATIVFLAGHKRHMPKTALLHFHRASMGVWGNVNMFEEAIAGLHKFEQTIISAIVERSGGKLTEQTIRAKWLDGGEHYETSTDMSALGLVDQETDEPAKLPKVADLQNYKSVFAAYINNDAAPQRPSLFQTITNAVASLAGGSQNQKPEIAMKIHALKFLALQVLVQAFALPVNEAGKVELTPEQMQAIEKEFEAKETALKAAEAKARQNAEAAEKLTAAQAEIVELRAKMANTATPPVVAGKTTNVPPAVDDLALDPINQFVQNL